MSHTPGPWEATNVDDWHAYGDNAPGVGVAGRGYEGWLASVRTWDDARLIAAAPDLLAAAKLILASVDNLGIDAQQRLEAIQALSDAVDRAEGEA